MYECVIIGGGPAGMAAALYLKRRGINPLIIEEKALGGTLLLTDNIENYMGYLSISGFDLASNMASQINNLDISVIYKKVLKVSFDKNFIIDLGDSKINAKNVIVSSGKSFNKLKGSDKFLGKGVSYCAVCDGFFYKGKDVAVVGGGNSAFSEALYLSDLCDKVYVIVRGSIKADLILRDKVFNKENVFIVNASIKEFIGEDILSGVLLDNGDRLNLSGVFLAIGGKPNTDFLDIDLKTENGYLVCDKSLMTSFNGLYGAGDVILKDYYQIMTAINDGIIAALSVGDGK